MIKSLIIAMIKMEPFLFGFSHMLFGWATPLLYTDSLFKFLSHACHMGTCEMSKEIAVLIISSICIACGNLDRNARV